MSEERKAAERMLLRLLGVAAAFAVVRWVLPEVWDKMSPFIIAVPIAAALQPVIRFLHLVGEASKTGIFKLVI